MNKSMGFIVGVLTLLSLVVFNSSVQVSNNIEKDVETNSGSEKLVFYNSEFIKINGDCYEKFNARKLINLIKIMSVEHPHIVLAQSILETRYWKSKIFKENNNLFGMKRARSRPTTSIGVKNNHAYYETWRESLYDYMIYQSTYLSEYKSESEYLDYLGRNYAQDPNYVKSLSYIIEKYKLRKVFA